MNLAAWANFAVASVGASAALAGLIFVGISLNLDFVLENGHLPARAGTALATLVSTAVLNLCLLIPEQTRLSLALEASVPAIVLFVLVLGTLRATLRRRRPGDPWSWAFQPLITNSVTPLLILAAAVLTLTHGSLLLYALATVAGLVTAVWEAWVLLIEIRR